MTETQKILGETILWMPKNGFPQAPFQESNKENNFGNKGGMSTYQGNDDAMSFVVLFHKLEFGLKI